MLELYERRTAEGTPYIVAKAGFLLQAVIMPYDVINQDITNLGGGAALFSAAVEMTASYRASSSTTLLPASAVRGSGDSRYVYIVSEESNALGQRVLKVKKQDVKVLSEVGSTVSIQDDLSRQRVAYMEDRAISDGSEVMVYGE